MTGISDLLRSMPSHYYLCKAEEFNKFIQNRQDQIYFLDLRQQDEFLRDGIPGAKHCLLKDLPDRFEELFPSKENIILAYCNGGIQSVYAVVFLILHGYSMARSLAGGYKNFLSKFGAN